MAQYLPANSQRRTNVLELHFFTQCLVEDYFRNRGQTKGYTSIKHIHQSSDFSIHTKWDLQGETSNLQYKKRSCVCVSRRTQTTGGHICSDQYGSFTTPKL